MDDAYCDRCHESSDMMYDGRNNPSSADQALLDLDKHLRDHESDKRVEEMRVIVDKLLDSRGLRYQRHIPLDAWRPGEGLKSKITQVEREWLANLLMIVRWV